MSFVGLEDICMAKRPVLLICLLDALVVQAPILFACLLLDRQQQLNYQLIPLPNGLKPHSDIRSFHVNQHIKMTYFYCAHRP